MTSKRIFAIAALAALAVIILAVSGVFDNGRVAPGLDPAGQALSLDPPPGLSDTAKARSVTVDDVFEAMGTIRPRTETSVEAQVTGKVLKVLVSAGDDVRRGQVLVRLDDREYQSRLERSRQALAQAEAARRQAAQRIDESRAGFSEADSQYKRIKTLFQEGAVTSRELEQAEAAYLQAESRLGQADDGRRAAEAAMRQAARGVEEADIALGYTVITAPEDAEVAERSVEPGDLAAPGRTLITLQTASSLRLEAFVREGLIGAVRPGRDLDVAIGALGATVHGVVEEVVPSADPATRTFLVKVGLPAMPGAYPGMFGRLLVPAGQRRAVLVPASAVRRVGQLETVAVREEGGWRQVFVKTGRQRDGVVEVLSGLTGHETVAVAPMDAPASEPQAAPAETVPKGADHAG